MKHFTGYGAYLLFLALRTHFSSDKYDFFKMHGKLRATKDSYEKRQDNHFFDKIANGGLLFVITAVWIDDATAVRWVIAVLPPICALIGCLLAIAGTRLYSSRLAKLSHMNNPKLSL